MKSLGSLTICFLLALSLSSCSDSDGTDSQIRVESSSAEFALGLPRIIADSRSVNRGNLDLIISINGTPINVDRNEEEDVWTAKTTVAEGSSVSISIEWIENFQLSRALDLAYWQESITLTSNRVIQLSDAEYTTTNLDGADNGLDFDVDQDGFSNLSERKADSNPLDSNSTPDSLPAVDVIIPVSTVGSPSIDGNYSSGDYNARNASFRDTSGEFLYINNLMLDEGQGTASVLPSRGNENAEMRWFAIHDNENLYIGVVGEDVQLSNPIGDSDDPWQDDNVNIFLDTDNSAGPIYDGINDYHFMIPLLSSSQQANKFNEAGSRIKISDRSGPLTLSQIEFATCGDECGTSGQHLWEIKIPFNSVGLQKYSVFGIDVQLDIDHDGGERDVKWGWIHPPGFDSTWEVPSRMGKGYIQ